MFFINKDIIKKDNLLKELDRLGYRERMKKIAILALSSDKEGFSELMNSMIDENWYEALLALRGAEVTKNIKVILQGLEHGNALVRFKAAGLLGKLGTAEDILRVIDNLSAHCRKEIIHRVSYNKRREEAEKLFPYVYSKWGEKEASVLLPACSHETAAKWIEKIGHIIKCWTRFAKSHPDVAADYFKKRLEEASESERLNIWCRYENVVEVLCSVRGEIILECAFKLGPKEVILDQLYFEAGLLAEIDSEKVYKLLLAKECRKQLINDGVPRSIIKRQYLFSEKQWFELGRILLNKESCVENILKSMDYAHREAFFMAVYETDKLKDRIVSVDILQHLPHKLRDKEALRMLQIREIYEDKNRYREIMFYRLIENSREFFEAEGNSSDVERRVQAVKYLIKSTVLSRSGMSDTLKYLYSKRNDQARVQVELLIKLSGIPVSLFNDEDIDILKRIVKSFMESKELAYEAKMFIEIFAFKIMKYNFGKPESSLYDFGVDTVLKLIKRNKRLNFAVKFDDTADEFTEAVFNIVSDLIMSKNKEGNYYCAVEAARRLGKRCNNIPKYKEILKEAIMNEEDEGSVKELLRYYLEDKKKRDERIKELLDEDKSFIKMEEVSLHVQTKRQEWLDEFIKDESIKGRFLSGEKLYLMPVYEGFDKWLPRQSKAFSALLEREASNEDNSAWLRARYVRTLGRIPGISADRILPFLDCNDEGMAEEALFALAKSEVPEKAVGALIDNLDSDRAKKAMYYMPALLKKMKHYEVMSIVKGLLNREKLKITVRKECVRLLGVYKNSESMKLLKKEFAKENVHRDVKIAIGYTVRNFLEYEESWEILRKIASSCISEEVLSLVNQEPENLAKEYRIRYLKLIIDIANNDDFEVSGAAFKAMEQWKEGNEEIIAEAAYKKIIDLNNTSSWSKAVDTLTSVCVDGKAGRFVAKIYEEFSNPEMDEMWSVKDRRDMPHRQRLERLTDELVSFDYFTLLKLEPLYMEIIKIIKKNVSLRCLDIKFYIALIDWNDTEGSSYYLGKIAECSKGMPYYLCACYDTLNSAVSNDKGLWEADNLLRIIDKVWHEGKDEDIFLTLPLLKAAGEFSLWEKDTLEYLKKFRNHNNIQISSMAYEIWTVQE